MVHRIIRIALGAALLCTVAACATTPQDRGPWHEYLHEKGLE